jgi:DNA-directed RNA polymerase specialized sigma24 family protein
LSPDVANLVRLRYVEARTTRGVGQAAGLPESTVRLRLAEARNLLERCLRGKGVLE